MLRYVCAGPVSSSESSSLRLINSTSSLCVHSRVGSMLASANRVDLLFSNRSRVRFEHLCIRLISFCFCFMKFRNSQKCLSNCFLFFFSTYFPNRISSSSSMNVASFCRWIWVSCTTVSIQSGHDFAFFYKFFNNSSLDLIKRIVSKNSNPKFLFVSS